MSTVFWKEEYNLGDDEIDGQHRHILTLIHALEVADESGAGASTVDLVLAHLIKFLGRHFTAEEELMDSAEYPSLTQHRQEHEECRHKLAEFASSIRSGRMAPLECIEFVRDWLHSHLLDSDQRYAAWLRKPAGE